MIVFILFYFIFFDGKTENFIKNHKKKIHHKEELALESNFIMFDLFCL